MITKKLPMYTNKTNIMKPKSGVGTFTIFGHEIESNLHSHTGYAALKLFNSYLSQYIKQVIVQTKSIRSARFFSIFWGGSRLIKSSAQSSCCSIIYNTAMQHLHKPMWPSIGDRSFRVTVARAWNSLPTSITALTSLRSFKRQLKTFSFTKSFPSV